jgi:predicted LPLAT superfamily acyltransferase
MKNLAVVLDIALKTQGNVKLHGTLRMRDVGKLRDVILTYPGTPATSLDMLEVTAVDTDAALALKAALDAMAGDPASGLMLSIRVCAGPVADAMKAVGFSERGPYALSVREC